MVNKNATKYRIQRKILLILFALGVFFINWEYASAIVSGDLPSSCQREGVFELCASTTSGFPRSVAFNSPPYFSASGVAQSCGDDAVLNAYLSAVGINQSARSTGSPFIIGCGSCEIPCPPCAAGCTSHAPSCDDDGCTYYTDCTYDEGVCAKYYDIYGDVSCAKATVVPEKSIYSEEHDIKNLPVSVVYTGSEHFQSCNGTGVSRDPKEWWYRGTFSNPEEPLPSHDPRNDGGYWKTQKVEKTREICEDVLVRKCRYRYRYSHYYWWHWYWRYWRYRRCWYEWEEQCKTETYYEEELVWVSGNPNSCQWGTRPSCEEPKDLEFNINEGVLLKCSGFDPDAEAGIDTIDYLFQVHKLDIAEDPSAIRHQLIPGADWEYCHDISEGPEEKRKSLFDDGLTTCFENSPGEIFFATGDLASRYVVFCEVRDKNKITGNDEGSIDYAQVNIYTKNTGGSSSQAACDLVDTAIAYCPGESPYVCLFTSPAAKVKENYYIDGSWDLKKGGIGGAVFDSGDLNEAGMVGRGYTPSTNGDIDVYGFHFRINELTTSQVGQLTFTANIEDLRPNGLDSGKCTQVINVLDPHCSVKVEAKSGGDLSQVMVGDEINITVKATCIEIETTDPCPYKLKKLTKDGADASLHQDYEIMGSGSNCSSNGEFTLKFLNKGNYTIKEVDVKPEGAARRDCEEVDFSVFTRGSEWWERNPDDK